MYKAKIENSNGGVLVLTGKEAIYQIINIEGLNPPPAQINNTTIVGLDGAVFNSSKLQTRNIVLTVKINGNVEANRLNLYKYFRTKDWCKFYYSNETLDVSIEGYVESVECNLFSSGETAQISILCLYPYFRSLSESLVNSSSAEAHFVFPFSINIGEPVVISNYIDTGAINVYNSSESETGVMIEIDVKSAVNSIELTNTSTGDDFILSYAFAAGDKILINTNKGSKSIALVRGGVISNLFAALQQGSTFFQLSSGNNVFEYLADDTQGSNDVYIIFRFYNTYRGV